MIGTPSDTMNGEENTFDEEKPPVVKEIDIAAQFKKSQAEPERTKNQNENIVVTNGIVLYERAANYR